MRKALVLPLAGALVFAAAHAQEPVPAPDLPAVKSSLYQGLIDRARDQVARVEALVQQGTLPHTRLDEAREHLADLVDAGILADTLYSTGRVQDMTSEQASEMLAAAQRRVNRQASLVADRRNLFESGILARSEFATFETELESRRHVLDLATNRAKLLDELRQMAEAEQRSAHAAEAALAGNLMVRYPGNGVFNPGDLTTISKEFERRFHRVLPVSALGQTAVHRMMGLDHRNRVDVALNPDGQEGIWLRAFLEKLHVPYIAFRAAIAGAATAPHIHIGPGSTRLSEGAHPATPHAGR
jgi:hypothetical protein